MLIGRVFGGLLSGASGAVNLGAQYVGSVFRFLGSAVRAIRQVGTQQSGVLGRAMSGRSVTPHPGPALPSFLSGLDRWSSTGNIEEAKRRIIACFRGRNTDLDLSNLGLDSLPDLSQLTFLQSLNCSSNQLRSLDVSQCPALQTLNCVSNQLGSLDVSQCPVLQYFFCDSNQLQSLDVSQCSVLKFANCSHNQLNNLDVHNNTALVELDCSHNQLGAFDVSANIALQRLDYSGNQPGALVSRGIENPQAGQ